jgi:hypothetical protein
VFAHDIDHVMARRDIEGLDEHAFADLSFDEIGFAPDAKLCQHDLLTDVQETFRGVKADKPKSTGD